MFGKSLTIEIIMSSLSTYLFSIHHPYKCSHPIQQDSSYTKLCRYRSWFTFIFSLEGSLFCSF